MAEQLILGIESSCDDTAVALLSSRYGVVAHTVRSQNETHARYEGVVPELASRDHVAHLLPLVAQVLNGRKPDSVACTAGPGLAGCLAVGVGLAQALAYAWQIPLVPVHHLEGHLLSPFLDPDCTLDFPYLALLVSGGHTAIYDVAAPGQYRLLGATLDDAAGEAFDKTATLLKLGYPGGKRLEQLAQRGDAQAVPIPAAMRKRNDLALSFSGLKTAARYRLQEGHRPADIAAAFQAAAVATLTGKMDLALQRTSRRHLAVVGGVGCNAALRAALADTAADHNATLHHPPLRWCTDNAAMIAYTGLQHKQAGYGVTIRPRWPLPS